MSGRDLFESTNPALAWRQWENHENSPLSCRKTGRDSNPVPSEYKSTVLPLHNHTRSANKTSLISTEWEAEWILDPIWRGEVKNLVCVENGTQAARKIPHTVLSSLTFHRCILVKGVGTLIIYITFSLWTVWFELANMYVCVPWWCESNWMVKVYGRDLPDNPGQVTM